MEFVETFSEGLVRKCEGRLEPDEIEGRINSEIEELRPTLTLPGFRKGKVPSHVVRARFSAAMTGELVDKIVSESFNRHLEESGNKPAFQPRINMDGEVGADRPGPGRAEPMDIRVEYECMPSIPEIEFSEIELTRMRISDMDAMVETRFGRMALQMASFEDTEDGYQAVDGDEVGFDSRILVDGEEVERYAASGLVLRARDEPQARQETGFDLVGVKVGDKLSIDRQVPDPGAEEGAMVSAEQEISVTAIRRAIPAELTEETLQEMQGVGLEETKLKIESHLSEWCAANSERVMHKELLDRLDEMVDFQMPPTLLARELANTRRALGEDEAGDKPEAEGGTDEDGIQAVEDEDGSIEDAGSSGTSDEEIEKLATRRLKLGLYLVEVAGKNDITVSEAEILARVQESYPRETRRFGARELIAAQPALREQIAGMEVERKVMRFIANLASVKVEDLTHDEISRRIREFDAED